MDEATSALDAQSEAIVQQALDEAAKHCSVIMIAHRLSTVINADEILVMESGTVVERGQVVVAVAAFSSLIFISLTVHIVVC